MGAGASATNLPDQFDSVSFKAVAGEHYTDEVFNAFKNEDGFISKEKVLALQDMQAKTHKLRADYTAACKKFYFHMNLTSHSSSTPHSEA